MKNSVPWVYGDKRPILLKSRILNMFCFWRLKLITLYKYNKNIGKNVIKFWYFIRHIQNIYYHIYFHKFATQINKRAQFQKGLNPLLVDIELLEEYGRVFKAAQFDTNFMFLEYLAPELWSSAIFRKISVFEKFWLFISKNNINLIFFPWEIIDGNVSSKWDQKNLHLLRFLANF